MSYARGFGRKLSGKGGGSGGVTRAQVINRNVALVTGLITTVSKYGLLAPVTFAKASGNANLTINSSTGDVSATAALAEGATQSMAGTITGSDGVVLPFTLNCTGQVVLTVPAAPSLTATAGNGQVTLAWADGSDGGATITAHKLYRGTASGSLTLVGTILSGSPYVDTGLTNGTAYYYKLSAVNAEGESALSTEQSATPSATPTRLTVVGDSWVFNGAYYMDTWAATAPGTIVRSTVANNGWGIADVRSRVANIAATDPHVITVCIGFNNLTAMTDTALITEMQGFASDLYAACPNLQKIGFQTIQPSTNANINTRRVAYNAAILAGVGVWHDFPIPYGEYLIDADCTDTSLYDNTSAPGHPKTALGVILAKIYGAVVNPIFNGATATSPSAFIIADVPGSPTSKAYTQQSNEPITGMAVGTGATGVLTGAGTWRSSRNVANDTSNKTVFNGFWPAISATSSATYPPNTSVDSTLTIGTTAETFTTTTGVLASDDFNRADGVPGSSPLGGNAVSVTWEGPARIAANALTLGQQSKSFGVCNTGITDKDFTFKVTIPSGATVYPRLVFFAEKRASPTTTNPSAYFNNYYFADFVQGFIKAHHLSFGDFALSGGTGGSFTALTAGATYTVRIVAKRSDGTINMYVDGVLWCSTTVRGDVPVAVTGYYVGGCDEQASANVGIKFDDFSVQAAA